MAFPIEKKLVVGVSSNALFNLEKEDEIFETYGLEAYRQYQEENRNLILEKGDAYPFIKRFLNINKSYPNLQRVEVVLLSRNSPETGLRVFDAIKHYDLDISRAIFSGGKPPFPYIPAYNISLFLSTNVEDVTNAIHSGYPAGLFLKSDFEDDENDLELRVAFDFDGVIADDEAEKVYKETDSLAEFHEYESKHKLEPHEPGPLANFFKKISYFQRFETKKQNQNKDYKKNLRTSIVTARNAPSHERAIITLNSWGVNIDDMFLMGGVDKSRVLNVLKPHIFFDDQKTHLDPKLSKIPLVHIPFGIANNHNKE